MRAEGEIPNNKFHRFCNNTHQNKPLNLYQGYVDSSVVNRVSTVLYAGLVEANPLSIIVDKLYVIIDNNKGKKFITYYDPTSNFHVGKYIYI